MLIGHDRTAVILDYFTHGRHPSLTTPEGASLTGETVEALAGAGVPEHYVQATNMASTRVPIGRVEKVSGSATVLRNGVPVELHLGDMVAKGDVVQTGSDSTLAIRFNDGTVFGLSSNARIVLNDMVYAADATSNSALFTLVQGVIGFVAGRIAKTGDLKVDTPVATMAIRGTAVQTEVSAFSGVTKISVLTEPDGSVGSVLLLDKNNPLRVLTSVSNPRVATLLTPIGASDPQITQITKTADDLRGESDFVRDLFQIFSPQPQRRGSSDVEDTLIIPINLPMSIDLPDLMPFDVRLLTPERAAARDQPIPTTTFLPEQIRGTAVEDGPVAQLGVLIEAATSANGITPPLVSVPASLPPGVRYIESSRSFFLDPSHPAYQHLGEGETTTVIVNYSLVIGDVRIPTTVSWTIAGRNDAPVAENDAVRAVGEVTQTILSLRANDHDVDGDPLHVVRWTNPLEGSLHLDASGNLVFDPGDDFQALSAGQTATISFTYTVSDPKGETDTANATLKVAGAGEFSSPQKSASARDILEFNNQPVVLTITAPSATTTPTAALDLIIRLGPVVQPQMNILYLIDVSGSTSERFEGQPVGDLNADGRSNTVLDAEIASLITLTERISGLGFSPTDVEVTVIPFNGSADPTTGSGDNQPVTATTFNLEGAGEKTIVNYLRGLDAGGQTNFADALRAANERLQGLDQGNEKNVLYFLSDGAGQGSVEADLARLNDEFGARIAAIGVGEGATLSRLNEIDNTGGALRLTSPGQIETSVLGSPVPRGEVADLDVFVNGKEIAEIGREDLIPRSQGFALDATIGDLERLAGGRNTVAAVVTFESGEVLRTELTIAGALPRSTDLVL
ncbi:Ig-like domain-containing protein [Microvirga vignae]|uniref:Ig-like domain-containing protein n=1 Tax=Microvirga vignae TaxID=1225564 RepID=UPI0012371D3A|nr:Ig-like domain-containing protein [Microvirga vignae]